MNDIPIDKQPIKKLKTCSYKSILGCICLVIILAIFCAAELAVMKIFMVFAFSYVIIAIAGGAYLLWLAVMKAISCYKNKKTSKEIDKNLN